MRLRDSNICWRELDGETVILDLATSKYLSVNSAGTVLLHQLAAGESTRDDLTRTLVRSFDIPPEQAEADVDHFLASLIDRGLLVTT